MSNVVKMDEQEIKQRTKYRVIEAQKMIHDAIRQMVINNHTAPDIYLACDSLLRLEFHLLFRTRVTELNDITGIDDVTKKVSDVMLDVPGARWISSWRRPGRVTSFALIEKEDSFNLFLTEYEEKLEYDDENNQVTVLTGKIHEVAVNSDFYLNK